MVLAKVATSMFKGQQSQQAMQRKQWGAQSINAAGVDGLVVGCNYCYHRSSVTDVKAVS